MECFHQYKQDVEDIINRYIQLMNNLNNCFVFCPCCHHQTINNFGHYEICSICGWEDDPIQLEDPETMLAGRI